MSQIIPQMSTAEILVAAEEHLKTHNYVDSRDIYYAIAPKWKGYRGGYSRCMRNISFALLTNGYVCIERRSKGYSRYQKKELINP